MGSENEFHEFLEHLDDLEKLYELRLCAINVVYANKCSVCMHLCGVNAYTWCEECWRRGQAHRMFGVVQHIAHSLFLYHLYE